MNFDKKYLIKTLDEIEWLHLLANAGRVLLNEKKNIELLERTVMVYAGRCYDLKDFAKYMKDRSKRNSALNDLFDSVQRLLIREPFSLIKKYCERNDEESLLESQTWYPFARILRNYASHGILNPNKYKNVSFPVQWNNYILTENDLLNFDKMFPRFDDKIHFEVYDAIKVFTKNLPDIKRANTLQ